MNLVIDRGNTHLKFGIFDECRLLSSDSTDFLDQSKIEKLSKQYPINSAILSSVVSERNQLLTNHLKSSINHFIELDHTTRLPFTWSYKSKNTIGKDRLAAIAGAMDLYPKTDLIVFDAGTALTYELINSNGEFIGGNISPGMHMRFKSLNTFTSRLPLLEATDDYNLLGNSTDEAITAGVQNSLIFEIDGIVNHFKQHYPQLKAVITGGDAEFFARKVKNPIFVAPNLVLVGLNRILKHNVQPT